MIVEELCWQSFKTIEKRLQRQDTIILVNDGSGNTFLGHYLFVVDDLKSYYQIIVDSDRNVLPEMLKYWCKAPIGPKWEEL
jgi:hypothetical protein